MSVPSLVVMWFMSWFLGVALVVVVARRTAALAESGMPASNGAARPAASSWRRIASMPAAEVFRDGDFVDGMVPPVCRDWRGPHPLRSAQRCRHFRLRDHVA